MRLNRGLVALTICWLVAPEIAHANIEKMQIKGTAPYHMSHLGQYIKITGTFTGSLDPKEPIPNLARASRRPDGRVEYTTDFVILALDPPRSGNRVMLFDVENRGRPVVHGMYNSPLGGLVSQLEVGNGFLEDNGYIIVMAGWQNGQGIVLPAYPGPDGKPIPLDAVGFAAVRDVVDFLRYEPRDQAGTPNPIAGATDFALAAGSSQTARVLKSFIYHGFNRAGARMVFEGVHPHLGQSGTMPFIPPENVTAETIALTLTGDSSVFPFTYADIMAPLAARGEKAPKILATNVEGDYYRRRQSLVRTGANGTADVPLADSVRIWDIAGGTHGIVLSEGCDMPRANLDWHPLLRAALVKLTRWVTTGEAPPATRLIELTSAAPASYLMPAPKDYPNAQMMVPKRDGDDIAVGGVRLPAVAVPLGTSGTWNAPLETNCGDMSGFFYPFPRTRFQRMMTHDTRQALDERYQGAADYLKRFTDAAQQLVRDGYLLDADAQATTGAAAEKTRPLFPEPKKTLQ